MTRINELPVEIEKSLSKIGKRIRIVRKTRSKLP